MTSIADFEWGQLTRAWAGVGAEDIGERIRDRVVRQSRRLRIVVMSEIVLTLVVLGAVGFVVLTERTAAAIGLGVLALGHSALVWGFTIWNRHGVWRPLGESTREYLALARERCRRERRSARFVIALVATETLGTVAWVIGGGRPSWTGGEVPGWWVPPLAVISGAIGWAAWADRRSRRELSRLTATTAALGFDSV